MFAFKRTRKTVGEHAELVYVGEGLVPKNLPCRIPLNTSGNTIGRGILPRTSYDSAAVAFGVELTMRVRIQETAGFTWTAKSSRVC